MPANFFISLDIMWKGMLGIFSVILLIMFIVMVIQWFEHRISNAIKDTENQE